MFVGAAFNFDFINVNLEGTNEDFVSTEFVKIGRPDRQISKGSHTFYSSDLNLFNIARKFRSDNYLSRFCSTIPAFKMTHLT